ncbi:hypothetical protein [Marinivivus vitaminiproducens]|uniref:hypothetical protein n=1 Tax=Marinivivus vitaminiproducens TaxID=3035935 RepID=UPI0027A5007A|nr:hypothetical protein P4R82_05455 [Geminicoccaceae bacterium SCSIO 64248]
MVVVDPDTRRSKCRLLSAYRIRCIDYDGPDHFLRWYEQQPGCLTLDLQGHGARPSEFLRLVKRSGVDLPAIVMDTGFRFSERAEILRVAPDACLLAKPADPVAYVQIVRRLLRVDERVAGRPLSHAGGRDRPKLRN